MRAIPLAMLLACQSPPGGWGSGGKPSTDTGPGNSAGDDTAGTDTADTGDSADTAQAPVGTGYDVGDVAYDLSGADAAGKDWSLYDQLGAKVVLVAGHMDYPTLVATMEDLPAVHLARRQAVLAALIGRDEYSTAADADDAARWETAYDLDAALVDPLSVTVDLWSDNNPPKTYVIGTDMVIAWVGFETSTADEIEAALDAAP